MPMGGSAVTLSIQSNPSDQRSDATGRSIAECARSAVALALSALLVMQGCAAKVQKRQVTEPRSYRLLDRASPYLKAHLKSGNLVVFSQWTVDTTAVAVSGAGKRFDPNRVGLDSGQIILRIDSVALFETNRVQTSRAVAMLAVLTGVTALFAIVCISDPKTCFGSCPTFYVTDGNQPLLQAEGFSSSVSPALERRDIDALYRAQPSGRELAVVMKNEAMETQVIRYADILAVPREGTQRVFATADGEFYQAVRVMAPASVIASEGDCTDLVYAFDGNERFSLADSTDLATRETIDLQFDSIPSSPCGLVIGSRQTLLTTFLFYQTLAYMGTQASAWMATLERNKEWTKSLYGGLGESLGWIEVQVPDPGGDWKTVGMTRETGPLAADVRMVPLPELPRGSNQVRLRLTKGHWRLDYLALAELGKRIEPTRITPHTVYRFGLTDSVALGIMQDTLAPLVTMPGDEYKLVYELPEDFDQYELFMMSKGYYLEWMRQEWLAEENSHKAILMFTHPDQAMRLLAPEFKKVEPVIEANFWGSRYARP